MNVHRLSQIEQTLLGAPLLHPDMWPNVSDICPDDWLHDSHRVIHRAMCALVDSGSALDALTLIGELERRGDLSKIGGGAAYISDLVSPLTAGLARPENLANYRRTLREAAGKRLAAKQFEAIASAAQDETMSFSDLQSSLEQIHERLGEYPRLFV